MKNMQNHYVNGIDARSLMAKIPLFMKLCSFLLLTLIPQHYYKIFFLST